MKKIILSFCIIGLMFIGQSGAGETKPPLQIAIYPFHAVGINETVATVITNAVYRELVNSDKLVVRDQQSTQAAIDQIGLSQSGHCTEDACTVEAGKIIKAQKLIMGSVEMVMENYYTVSMRVVDVQTARTEYQVQHDCESCKNNVEIRNFAVKVVKETVLVFLETGKKPPSPSESDSTAAATTLPPSQPAAPAPTYGTIGISSAPAGADVYVDGTYVGKTPINFSGVTAGLHKVQVQLAGYQAYETNVNVAANQVVPVNANLTSSAPLAAPTETPSTNRRERYPSTPSRPISGTGVIQSESWNKSSGHPGSAELNWTNQTVEATGIGTINPRAPNVGVARAGCLREATVNAQRNIFEILLSSIIDSEASIEKYIATSDVVKAQFVGVLRGAVQKDQPVYKVDGSCEIKMQIKLPGPLSEASLPPASEFGRYSVPAGPQSVYTGLIIDASGLGALPAFAPKIIDESGNQVYGIGFIKREYAVNNGVAGYAKSSEQARSSGRVGSNPLVLRAVRASGFHAVDLIISNTDANKLRDQNIDWRFLQETRVVIVL